MATGDDKKGPFDKISDTPQGKEVVDTFWKTLTETGNPIESAKRAEQVAKTYGIAEIMEVSLFIQFVTTYGPILYQTWQVWMSKMNENKGS
jgi:hypothetical protein